MCCCLISTEKNEKLSICSKYIKKSKYNIWRIFIYNLNSIKSKSCASALWCGVYYHSEHVTVFSVISCTVLISAAPRSSSSTAIIFLAVRTRVALKVTFRSVFELRTVGPGRDLVFHFQRDQRV